MKVDGVTYSLKWQEFDVGSSFFIPCLGVDEARLLIERKMARLGFKIEIKSVIENEVRGLRVWRKRTYTPGAT
jgi:hypothetical protein